MGAEQEWKPNMSEDEDYPEWASESGSDAVMVDTDKGTNTYVPPVECEYCSDDAVAVVIMEYQGVTMHAAICEDKMSDLDRKSVSYEARYL